MTPQDHEPVRDSQNGPFFALFLLDWAPKKPRLRLNERSAQGSNLSVFFILKKAKKEEFHYKEALLSFSFLQGTYMPFERFNHVNKRMHLQTCIEYAYIIPTYACCRQIIYALHDDVLKYQKAISTLITK